MSDTPNATPPMTARPQMPAPYVAMLAQIDSMRMQLDALSAMVHTLANAQHAAIVRAQSASGRTTAAPGAPMAMPPVFGGQQAASAPHSETDALTDRLSSAEPLDG